MKSSAQEITLNLFLEVRKQIIEYQKIRAQLIGVKITFVSAGIGLIVANLTDLTLLVIPAFAAICFDLLIASYAYSIKRTGFYCRHNLEPTLQKSIKLDVELDKDFLLWEEFMRSHADGSQLSLISNLGITVLSIAPAVVVLFPFTVFQSQTLVVLMACFFGYDIFASVFLPRRFSK